MRSFDYNNNNNNTNINTYNEHYTLFCNNISPSLQKELGINNLNNNTFNSSQNWKPPNTYGLENSQRIIPEHYFEKNNNFKEIDMFYELTKDIRNLKPLTKIQLDYIKTLTKKQITELLELYNSCFESINNLLEKL